MIVKTILIISYAILSLSTYADSYLAHLDKAGNLSIVNLTKKSVRNAGRKIETDIRMSKKTIFFLDANKDLNYYDIEANEINKTHEFKRTNVRITKDYSVSDSYVVFLDQYFRLQVYEVGKDLHRTNIIIRDPYYSLVDGFVTYIDENKQLRVVDLANKKFSTNDTNTGIKIPDMYFIKETP